MEGYFKHLKNSDQITLLKNLNFSYILSLLNHPIFTPITTDSFQKVFSIINFDYSIFRQRNTNFPKDLKNIKFDIDSEISNLTKIGLEQEELQRYKQQNNPINNSTIGSSTLEIIERGEYLITNDLNDGGFGSVKKIMIKEGRYMALKLYIKDVSTLSSPPISSFFLKIHYEGIKNQKNLQVSELYEGNIIEKKYFFSLYDLIKYSLILLRYDITHYDIKPANFLIKGGKIVLCDCDGMQKMSYKTNCKMYTKYYSPISIDHLYSWSFDIYSLAMTYFESKNNYVKMTIDEIIKNNDNPLVNLISQDPVIRIKTLILIMSILRKDVEEITSLINSDFEQNYGKNIDFFETHGIGYK